MTRSPSRQAPTWSCHQHERAGLENLGGTGLGFAAADAAAVVNMAAILNTPAAVYFGTATQASQYDFHTALCPLWA